MSASRVSTSDSASLFWLRYSEVVPRDVNCSTLKSSLLCTLGRFDSGNPVWDQVEVSATKARVWLEMSGVMATSTVSNSGASPQ